jgi:hypothetical protein
MMQNNKTIFPDTNILLHYPPIDEIDWVSWCNCKSIKVVLCLQVIDELDVKKNDPNYNERAKKALKKINELKQTGGSLKDGVFLETYVSEFNQNGISADEIIIRQTLDYKNNHQNEEVYIMTEDSGMLLRCNQRINTIEPDKKQRLESPKSDLQKENAKLKAELTKLQNKLPDLNLFVTQTNSRKINPPEMFIANFYSVSFATEDIIDAEYNAFIDALRDDPFPYPYSIDSNEYKKKLSKYLEQYNNAMKELYQSFPFTIRIENLGSVPAENILIKLTFPKIFRFLACGEYRYGNKLIILEMPHLPIDCNSTRTLQRFPTLKKIPEYYNFSATSCNPDKMQIDFHEDPNTILMNLKTQKILHHHSNSNSINCIAEVISIDKDNSFELEYDIFAENMPTPKTGKIPFIIKENVKKNNIKQNLLK